MELDPVSYECPQHHVDLTAQVRETLEEHGVPAAYRPGRRWRPFREIVDCAAGPDGGHQLTCEGSFR